MVIRRFPPCVMVACLLFAAAARGQVVEEDESESVKSSEKASALQRGFDRAEVAKLIVDRTNEFRQAKGRRKVQVDAKLTETAQYFADYMARTDKYGHHADGSTPGGRAKKHGYGYCIISENIAYQYDSSGFATEELARKFFRGWKRSPGHRKNMLDHDVTETGVAIARSEESGHYYAVQMFGRPKSRMIRFEVTNESGTAVEYEMAGRTFSLPPRVTRTHGRCRPAELTVHWPTEQKSAAVQPDDGDRFVLVRDGGRFRLKRE